MASSREESPQTGPSFLTLNLLGNSRHSELQRVTASCCDSQARKGGTTILYEGLWACFLLGLMSGQSLGKTVMSVAPAWRAGSLASREGVKVERERAESSAGRMTGSLPRIRADGRRITPKAPGFESVVPDCQGHLPDWGSLTGPIASSRVSDPRITLNRTWEPWWSGQSTLLARHGRAWGDPH